MTAAKPVETVPVLPTGPVSVLPKLSVTDLTMLLSSASIAPDAKIMAKDMVSAFIAVADAAATLSAAAATASEAAMAIANMGHANVTDDTPASPVTSAVVPPTPDAEAGDAPVTPEPVTGPYIPSRPWYTVTVGRRVGTFDHWSLVSPLVTGVSNACFAKHASKAEADAIFRKADMAGAIRVVPDISDNDSGDDF